MFKLFVTLLRGRTADATEVLTETLALPILRQQLRGWRGTGATRGSHGDGLRRT